ncbi:MAG: hypothetical protein ACPGN3_09630 [Opitutales bacterium]
MYTLFEAHPVTVLIVVAALMITPFHLMATFAFSKASLRVGAALAALWLAFGSVMFLVCITALPQKLGLVGNLIIPAAWILPSVFLVIFRDRVLADNLSQKWLIGLQVWRLIGAVFLIEMARGHIPGVFAYPAGIGDIAVGVLAIGVLLLYRNEETVPSASIHAVGVLGVLDFVSAFFFGFFSSDTPLQLFSFDHPNPVSLFPTGLIPLFLVPYAIFFHTLSWLSLAKSK